MTDVNTKICCLLGCSEAFVRVDICRVSAQRVFPSTVTSRTSGVVAMVMRMCCGFSRAAVLTQEYMIPKLRVICVYVHVYACVCVCVCVCMHEYVERKSVRERVLVTISTQCHDVYISKCFHCTYS